MYILAISEVKVTYFISKIKLIKITCAALCNNNYYKTSTCNP